MIRTTRLIAVLGATLLAAGCQGSTPGNADGSNANPSQDAAQPAGGQAKASDSAKLSAAAELLEALTEEAFSANPARFASLLADVDSAAKSAQPSLPAATAEKLNARIADAKAAVAAHRPADIALAAVEGYRLVVSEFPETAKIPPAVSLLDYTGFRIQADLKSTPARWDDSQSALAFGNGQWAIVSARIGDKALTAKFQTALDELGSALAARDLAKANKAAAHELDLVDELEMFFDKA